MHWWGSIRIISVSFGAKKASFSNVGFSATHLQKGIFNEEVSYYDLWQANDVERREKKKEMEALMQQISTHKAHEEVKNYTIERLQVLQISTSY